MPGKTTIRSVKASRPVWLLWSLLLSGATFLGMAALDLALRQRQQPKWHPTVLWMLLSLSYWLLVGLATGEWRWKQSTRNRYLHSLSV